VLSDITFLIGHRGVGKSSLLKRMASYQNHLLCIDLDDYICQKEKRQVSEIFIQNGEPGFRDLEKKYLSEILESYNTHKKTDFNKSQLVVALGAGFELNSFLFPKACFFLWVRRLTDPVDRIFFDRPDLFLPHEPLEKLPKNRYPIREKLYSDFATTVLELLEGPLANSGFEKRFFEGEGLNLKQAIVTILPWHLKYHSRLLFLISQGIELFEIRSDLLNHDEISLALLLIPKPRVLISLRSPTSELLDSFDNFKDHLIDLEIKDEPFWKERGGEAVFISSSHTNELPKSNLKNEYIKWSPLIGSYSALKTCLDWQKSNPTKHILMPRGEPKSDAFESGTLDSSTLDSGTLDSSTLECGASGGNVLDGNNISPRALKAGNTYKWLRLYLKGKQAYHFLKWGPESSHLDQPTIYEWHMCYEDGYSALIGEHIDHSWSPSTHAYFNNLTQTCYTTINLSPPGLETKLNYLFELGFARFSVTSPLKSNVYDFITQIDTAKAGASTDAEASAALPYTVNTSDLVNRLKVVNTLAFIDKALWAHNTDFFGVLFQLYIFFSKPHLFNLNHISELLSTAEMFYLDSQLQSSTSLKALDLSNKLIIVGGGGMLPVLKSHLPGANYYSARKSDFLKLGLLPFEGLLWAAGSIVNESLDALTIKFIMDLSYTENSPAKAFAKKRGLPYYSGAPLFFGQAYEQHIFWKGLRR